MSVLLENMPMIGLNSLLALVPILFGWLMIKTRSQFLQGACALIWISFLPNTLYILTDLRYFPNQWNTASNVGRLGLIVQYGMYALVGVSSFLFAIYPLEKFLLQSRWRKKTWMLPLLLIVLNFFIGFGMVLGRVQRINSWDIFFDAPKVLQASLQILSSVSLLSFVLLFGIIANAIYLVFSIYREVNTAHALKVRK